MKQNANPLPFHCVDTQILTATRWQADGIFKAALEARRGALPTTNESRLHMCVDVEPGSDPEAAARPSVCGQPARVNAVLQSACRRSTMN